MSNTIKEQIKVMQHFANGGEVVFYNAFNDRWESTTTPEWNWRNVSYRIKDQKKTVTIEKWLVGNLNDSGYFWTVEGTKEYFNGSAWDIYKKVKLLETYEVEL